MIALSGAPWSVSSTLSADASASNSSANATETLNVTTVAARRPRRAANEAGAHRREAGTVRGAAPPAPGIATGGRLAARHAGHADASTGIETLSAQSAQGGTISPEFEPGSPWQNPYVESFHSRVRDELLDVEELSCLAEARVVIGDWHEDYKQRRPHSSLGMLAPAVFAARWNLGSEVPRSLPDSGRNGVAEMACAESHCRRVG